MKAAVSLKYGQHCLNVLRDFYPEVNNWESHLLAAKCKLFKIQ